MAAAVTYILREAFAGDPETLASLRLLCGWSNERMAQELLVSPATVSLWLRGKRSPSPTAVRLMSILAGYFPWPDWYGWEMHNDRLFPPGTSRNGYRPFDLQTIRQLHQYVNVLSADNDELKAAMAKRIQERDLLDDIVAQLIDQMVLKPSPKSDGHPATEPVTGAPSSHLRLVSSRS